MDGLTLRLRDVSSGLDNIASSIDVDGRNVVVDDGGRNVADDDDSDVKSVASDVKAKAVTPSRRSATASTPGPSTQKFSSRVSTTSFLASVAKSEQAPPRKSTPVRFVLSLGFL